MSGLTDALAASRADKARRADRVLLRRPLLRQDDDFVLVRRHAPVLRDWFERNTGWYLLVDSEMARLMKTVAGPGDPTYPARDVKSKQAFGRRRYVLVCLALAALSRAEAQITLGRLAEQVVLGAADPRLTGAGVVFQLEGREERADMVAVVRLLMDIGVLGRVAGDEDAFVKDTGDVLYDVRRGVLGALLTAPRGPSTVEATGFRERLAALTHELPPTTDDLRNQRIRHHLTRRLLKEPVLYCAELDEVERTYLLGQRAAITARITELTGLAAEVRAEGIAMVDPYDDLTDVRMPESGTEGHATLLVAEYLASQAGREVPVGDIHDLLHRKATEHKNYWRRDVADPGAERALAATALTRLLAAPVDSACRRRCRRATCAVRYGVAEPTIQEVR
jgi:uncharacterized protein (TIGR02678 family)